MPHAENETTTTTTATIAPTTPTGLTEALESAQFGLDEAVTPIPPRYWWLKRLAIPVGPVLLTLLFVRFGWGWYAQRQLDAEIAKYVAAGEPIYPKDFDSSPVADKDNAAKLYLEAATDLTLGSDGPSSVQLDLSTLMENASEKREAIASLLANNAGVLEKLREARSCVGVDWKTRYRTPMFNAFMWNNLSGLRSLSKLLALAATHAESVGDVNEAVDYVLDAIAQASATDVRPSLIEHLVSIAQYALAARRIEYLIPSLRVCDRDTAAANNPSCVSGELIEKLRDAIGDTSEMEVSNIYAIHFERAMAFDMFRAFRNGGTPALGAPGASILLRVKAFAVEPVFLADALFTLQHLDKKARALKGATWPGALRLMPRAAPPVDVIDEWMHQLSTILLPTFDRAIVLHYRAVAVRRMAGVALAIRLYELDHGERPSALAELLPDYLDALPIDPFGDGEQTFGYLPDALWPRIFTIGPNGTDDAGEIGFRVHGGVHMDHLDPPFFLDGPAPRTREEFAKPRGSGQRREDTDQ